MQELMPCSHIVRGAFDRMFLRSSWLFDAVIKICPGEGARIRVCKLVALNAERMLQIHVCVMDTEYTTWRRPT